MKSDGAACLISEDEGWQYMDMYDEFPVAVRKLLRESKYNICCACFYKEYYSAMHYYNRVVDSQTEYRTAQEIIYKIEYQIARQARRVTIRWPTRPEYGV